jgi:nucleotide-binding universal stress UspA family protein
MAAVSQQPLLFPVLLATDGSASARLAQQLLYPLAAILPEGSSGEASGQVDWVTLNVKPRFLPGGHRGEIKPEPDENAAEQGATKAAEDSLEKIAEKSPEKSLEKTDRGDTIPDWLPNLVAEIPSQFRQQTLIKRGRPASEILQTAKQLSAGLIAVGEQGAETGLRELLLGSVSNAVAHYANCHVLIARQRHQKTAESSAPIDVSGQVPSQESGDAAAWRHVLLVLDGSQATPQAIALTRQLLPVGIEQVTLLSIQPPLTTQYLFGPFATPAPSWQLIQSLQEVQHEQSQHMLKQATTVLQETASQTLKIIPLSEIAEPGVTICQIAQQRQVDVVIIGSDRRVGLAQVRLGVTGSYLIHHAPCPILLCRPGK